MFNFLLFRLQHHFFDTFDCLPEILVLDVVCFMEPTRNKMKLKFYRGGGAKFFIFYVKRFVCVCCVSVFVCLSVCFVCPCVSCVRACVFCVCGCLYVFLCVICPSAFVYVFVCLSVCVMCPCVFVRLSVCVVSPCVFYG